MHPKKKNAKKRLSHNVKTQRVQHTHLRWLCLKNMSQPQKVSKNY